MEAAGKLKAVITQNIDGLHQAAGSKVVYELHGSTLRNHCVKCGMSYDYDYVVDKKHADRDGIARCSGCKDIIKPNVVLYGEGLDDDVVNKTLEALRDADMVIIGGTSLSVYPAAGFINAYRGDRIVLINRDPTESDGIASLVIHDSIGKVLSAVRV